MKNLGFTLIELLVTLTLLAILLTLAVPAYNKLIANTHATTQIDQLISAINLARSEAIKRRVIVTLCAASTNKKTCSSDWSKGWLVFVDKQASGKIDKGDTVLRIYPAIPLNHRLEWNTLHDRYLQMKPSGNTNSQDGSFIYYVNDQVQQKIIVSQTGRVRVETNPTPSK